eukprot:scaffold227993_cov13-Tisochrysis_lutea.AAC.1
MSSFVAVGGGQVVWLHGGRVIKGSTMTRSSRHSVCSRTWWTRIRMMAADEHGVQSHEAFKIEVLWKHPSIQVVSSFMHAVPVDKERGIQEHGSMLIWVQGELASRNKKKLQLQ